MQSRLFSSWNPSPKLPRLGSALSAAAIALAIPACMLGPDGTTGARALLSASCAVAPDQRASFMDRVRAFPLHVGVDRQFTFAERQSIAQAVGAWNSLGQSLVHQDFFAIDPETVEVTQVPSDPTRCVEAYGSDDRFLILKETSGDHWRSMSFTSATPGVTMRCGSGGYMVEQIMYIYPALVASSQFGSVVVHELGHAIGLDHSCDDKNQGLEGFLSCSALKDGNPYHDAIMYPWLRTGGRLGAEIKEYPRDNDRVRAECIAGPP